MESNLLRRWCSLVNVPLLEKLMYSYFGAAWYIRPPHQPYFFGAFLDPSVGFPLAATGSALSTFLERASPLPGLEEPDGFPAGAFFPLSFIWSFCKHKTNPIDILFYERSKTQHVFFCERSVRVVRIETHTADPEPEPDGSCRHKPP